MSNIIQNGASTTVNLQTGEKLAVSAVDGTFNAVIRAGVGVGTALATNALGGEYGPYVSPVVIQVSSSADGLVDFEVGAVPSLDYREPVTAVSNPLTGGIKKIQVSGVNALRTVQDSQFGSLSKNPVAIMKPAGSFESNAGVLNYTLSVTYLSPVPFYGVRVRLFNLAASAIVNCAAGVAASKNMTGGIFAATEAPMQVTVAGAPAFTKPAAISSAETANAIWSETVSDWIPCISVPRDDGGVGYLLVVRTFDPSAGNTMSNRCGGLGATAADVNAYAIGAVAGTTDKTFANWATFSSSVPNLGPAIGLELLAATDSLSVASFGDSTIAGTDSYFSGASGLTLSGVANAGNSRPVTWWNQGEASMNSASFMTLAEKFFTNGHRPNVVAVCPWSPNDTDKYTQAGINRCIGNAIRFLHEARKIGANAVLVTPCPVGGISATDEGFRRQIVLAIKAIATSFGCGLVDRDAIYTDYSSSSGGWLAGMNFNTVHPSPAAYLAESALWTAALNDYI